MKLNLLVLRCTNIEISKSFYELLGFNFVKEKHGKGVEHYASCIEGLVFEIYPLNSGETPCNTRLGFSVQSLETLLDRIQVHGQYEINGKTVYILLDPDGRKIELS
jgi:lactoylglutathione lyase